MYKYLLMPNGNDQLYLDAINDAEKCLILNPNYSKGYYIKAKLFFLKRNDDQALKSIMIA